jgi:hypothetical protein
MWGARDKPDRCPSQGAEEMWRFVLAHEEKRFCAIPLLQPVNRQISDQVGCVAVEFDFFAVANHRWVIVEPLAGQNLPVIESGGVRDEVPFADHGSLISGSFQQFGESCL